MPLPHSSEARLYYRAAKQRFDDAQWLLTGSRTTGAVYLAGYTVECYLKALVLEGVNARRRTELVAEFRGSRAHNIEWLAYLYRRHVGILVPRGISRQLARVASWSTDLRYVTTSMNEKEVDEFFGSIQVIVAWADGRL